MPVIRPLRLVLFVCLAAAVLYETYHITATWQAWSGAAGRTPDHFTQFTSGWTFFLPSVLALAAIAVASTLLLQPVGSKTFVLLVRDLLFVVLSAYFIWRLHQTIYAAYNPGHSGPYL